MRRMWSLLASAMLATLSVVFLGLPSSAEPGKTVVKGLVILVEFPDVKHDVTRNMVQQRFSRGLNSYVQEMSYGKVALDVDVTQRWYRLPDPVGRYKISPRNLEVDKSRVKKLMEDALNAADKDVDFSRYSFTAIFMGAKVADYGMVGLCGFPGMLGWTDAGVLKTKRGQVVKGGVAIFTFQAHLGTLFHDVAHILGGVKGGDRVMPCLYDHDLQAKPGPLRETAEKAMVNMGFWDPMSCHYYKRELPPPGICSWTRMRLGWLDESRVRTLDPGEETEVILGPLGDGSSEVLAIKIPVSKTSYYLVENRQPTGFDKNLPGHGILIMCADDTVPECRHGMAPVRLVDANPSVQLLQGACFEVGGKDTFRDKKNKFEIQLREKTGGRYRVLVKPL